MGKVSTQKKRKRNIQDLTLWFTGRPCAGKSTLSRLLRKEMSRRGYHVVSLDGDDLRGRLNADLGFTDADRAENLRRAAHVAQLFNENGSFVIATFVSPTNEQRDLVRKIIKNFRLCYIRCSLSACEKRDVKSMYKMARAGKIKNFTGVSAPFEEPDRSEIVVDTERTSAGECVRHILRELGV